MSGAEGEASRRTNDGSIDIECSEHAEHTCGCARILSVDIEVVQTSRRTTQPTLRHKLSTQNHKCRARRRSRPLGRHVGADVDRLGQLRDGHLETRLHVLEGLGILVVGNEGDGEALGAEAAGAADAVQVGVRHLGHVVVDDDVDTLDVDATTWAGEHGGHGCAGRIEVAVGGCEGGGVCVRARGRLARRLGGGGSAPQMSVETRMRCLKSLKDW